jgi:methionyl-tRNA formyltransferase
LTAQSEILEGVDWLVSYGYRYILREKVLEKFPRRAINLHIAYLPWNRGADPNLWSFLEDTPKGVTIHYMDPGIDTGEILAQREVTFGPDETLRTTYDKLTDAMVELFMEVWPEIRTGRRRSFVQPKGGTFHRIRDRAKVEHLLYKGWDTPVSFLIGKALGPARKQLKLDGRQSPSAGKNVDNDSKKMDTMPEDKKQQDVYTAGRTIDGMPADGEWRQDMFVFEDYRLRQLTEQDLNLVRNWRNSDHVRANMYTDHIISEEEHRAWFQRVMVDPTVRYLILEYRDRPVGLVNFTAIDTRNSKCMWGFYLGETDLPRGSGTIMGYLSMNYVFEEIQIRKVSGEVLDFNEPSQKLFRRLGFTEEGRLRQHVLKNGRYADVVLFSLLAGKWRGSERTRVENLLNSYKESAPV